MNYLIQEEGMHCFIMALCNAKRYFKEDSPEPGEDDYEYLIDLGCARIGSCINQEEVAKYLGLNLIPIDPNDITKESLPVILTARIPKYGARHASLIVDIDDNRWCIANYRMHYGSILEWVDKKDIKQTGGGFFPKGNINRNLYRVCKNEN